MTELVVNRPGVSREEIGNRLSSFFRPAAAGLLVALGYYLGAQIGFALTFQPHPVSTLWPPNSILLATLLLAPRRWWWFLLLSALPAHLLVELNAGIPTTMVLCWFVSNSTEALIGALFIRYLAGGPVRFDSIRRVTIFILAAVLAPFLSSFLDAGFVALNRWGSSSYWDVWRMRFFSNVLAELTLVPVIVMWSTEWRSAFKKTSPWRYFEAAILALGLVIVGISVFDGQQAGQSNSPALLYTPLPFLLWAAVRFGPRGVSTALMAVSFLAIWGAIHGLGPFITHSPEENSLSVQLFLILISLPLLTFGAVIEGQTRLRQAARKNEEQLELALNAARMGTWDWHINDNETKWSVETKRIFGFQPNDSEVPPEIFYEMLHEHDRQTVKEAIERAIRECGPYAAEFRMPQPDGTVRWVRGQGKVLVDNTGTPVRMVGVNSDITAQKEAEEQLRDRNRQMRALAGRLISAQEDERRRLSRELHDDLSQRIAALSVAISNLKRKPEATPQIVAELDQLHHQTKELTGHIRNLSHDLHPPALEHLGLKLAVQTYITQFQRQEDIDIDFTTRLKSERIPTDISICLYRIAVEGLRNVAKHSHTRSASVLLEENEQSLTLEITDKGVGFDLDEARSGTGLGLVSAEERIRLLQGTFEIRSVPEMGTTLVARIPMVR